MKIAKVKWNDHPVLGDLELDFTNSTTGVSFDTVLIAGENGTGKTTILETISTFLNRGSFKYFEYLEYIIDGRVYRAIPSTVVHPYANDFFDLVDDAGEVAKIEATKNYNEQLIDSNRFDIRYHGCVISKARADYKTKPIVTATTKKLDAVNHDNDGEDDFTSLKQLIVDITHQDDAEYTGINKAQPNHPTPWSVFYPNSKTFRFANAFDNFFENIKYEKVIETDNEKSITFTKHGKSISIDNLSTGEKQIVFRGIYLLKNSGKLDGAAIMIDEPELSMHPKWQQNILDYYKQLFTKGAIQNAQIFLATHSEYVLKNALSDKNKNLVIVLNDVSGTIEAKRIDAPSVLPSITSAETNYLAFDVVSNDYHIELYGYLQDKEGCLSVKKCDDFIKNHRLYDPAKHRKPSSHGTITYDTLSTYIRNAIHHPDPARLFSDEELRKSIELLIELCR